MTPFRTEIRNSPREQTLKVYLADTSLDSKIKSLLESHTDVKLIEIQDSIARDRIEENITLFRKDGVNINEFKHEIDKTLTDYFSKS